MIVENRAGAGGSLGAALVARSIRALTTVADVLGFLKRAFARKLGDEAGDLVRRSKNAGWMYEGGDGISLYRYVRSILLATLEKLTVANISDDFDRGTLSVRLKAGDFILVQGAHIFAKENSREEGPGQTTTGSRRANKVAVEFAIDRWEATSSSAHGLWLSGRVDVTSIIKVSTLSKLESGKFRIRGTALAIAQGFSGFKTREYATYPYRAGVYISDDES